MRDAVQPPIGSASKQPLEDMDPLPCPEDEEFFVSPDSASMEEAIGKFMEGLESQESSCFPNINRLVQSLPVPVQKVTRSMTHSEALEDNSVTVCHDIYQDIPVYTSIYRFSLMHGQKCDLFTFYCRI